MTSVVAKHPFDEPVTDLGLRRAVERGQMHPRPSLRASTVKYLAASRAGMHLAAFDGAAQSQVGDRFVERVFGNNAVHS